MIYFNSLSTDSLILEIRGKYIASSEALISLLPLLLAKALSSSNATSDSEKEPFVV